MLDTYFSDSYSTARTRFLDAAAMVGAEIDTYPVTVEPNLETTIDVAIVGKEYQRTILISSGVHGVEGFFGSAVQLAQLELLANADERQKIRYVFIHGVNPHGFLHLSRVNEDNVDLNRNFLINPNEYKGAPPGYSNLDSFLNPQTPPSRTELFKLKAMWFIGRYGLQTLKQSIAGGQFDYPKGLFYGGAEPATSTKIVQKHCHSWLSDAQHIVHIDFHTGLGKTGSYSLLLAGNTKATHLPWYFQAFGKRFVESVSKPSGTAYAVKGSFGEWMQHHFDTHDYRFVAAEFGTYNVIKVLGSIRANNRAKFYALKNESSNDWVKKDIMECFCPKSLLWRRRALQSGLKIIDQGVAGLLNLSGEMR